MADLPLPPRWSDPLLRSLLPPHRVDDVTGDLLEAYRDDPQQWGVDSVVFGGGPTSRSNCFSEPAGRLSSPSLRR